MRSALNGTSRLKSLYRIEGYFRLGGIFRAERHFLLFKDQLAESGRQKTKENIIPRGKLRLVETTLKATFHLTIFDIPMRPMREDQRHRRRFTC